MKNYIKRWLYNSKPIVASFVTGIGLFWLFVEIASHSTDGKADTYTKSVWLFGVVSIAIFIYALKKNKPKTSFAYKLRNKDNFIEVKVGDAFKNSGSLVIPFNDCFDVSLGGNCKNTTSLQDKLVTEFY
ncbi:MAG: DUF6430 domain-containing protein [Devosiaceae bacterium]|nr:DUF6430 domain-containing protein [Devosiaceae bacterium]